MQLVAVNGPGHFSIWKSGASLPQVAMATCDGATPTDQLTYSRRGSRWRYNYALTKKGNYEVTFQATATLADGTEVSTGYVTYYFRVGNFAPTAEIDTYAVSAGSQLTGNVLFNDSDPESDKREM
jgi:surface-anchored protein